MLGAAAAVIVVYRRWVEPWHQHWGATPEETDAVLPGDDVIAEPATQVTRAISIDAPPEAVWPWLVQMGADRGGFYSYDRLENLFGLGIHSANEIVEPWQRLVEGDVVYANRARTGGWFVTQIRPNEALVLATADLAAGMPLRRDAATHWEFGWAFVLRRTAPGGTRLLVRERVATGNRLTGLMVAPVGFVSFVMTRPMLRGIASRAESWQRRRERGSTVDGAA